MTGDAGSSGWPIACFFKLILEPRLDLQKLEIPRKFMRTHGTNLSNVICLNIPSGKVWEFKFVRANDRFFLQKGWPEFVKFYSLSHGHLLIFKYEGNSCFDVIVCDKSASEIEYPLGPDPQACREGCHLQKRKTTDPSKPSSSKKAKGMQTTLDKLIIAYNRRHSGLNPEEIKRVRAYYVHHCKHPSFARKMFPSCIRSKFAVGIAWEFAKKFLYNELFPCTYNLQTSTGKTWAVKSTARSNHTSMRLQGAGWRRFVSANNLKLGDICVFELINKQVFKVHILRDANAEENPKNLAISIVD